MNTRTISWALFITMTATATCAAQDLRVVDEVADEANQVEGDIFFHAPMDPSPPGQRTEFQKSIAPAGERFHSEEKKAAPDTIMQAPKVLEPNGKPIDSFRIYFFSGDTVQLQVPPELAGTEVPPTFSAPDFVSDPKSPVAGLTLPPYVTSALIIAPEGFKVVGRTSLLDGEPISLESFSMVRGKVELKGPPLENVSVVAHWHSFPFHPVLIAQPAEKRREGPGLFAMLGKARLAEDGSFEMAIPSGRVHFHAVVDHSTGELPALPSAGTSIGVDWWETVKPVALADNDVQTQQLQTHSFELMSVKGGLKQTDALAEALTQVKQIDGRVEVTRTPLVLSFGTNEDLVGFAVGQSDQPIQSVIRRAAIWGRSGGSREMSGFPGALIPIPDSGEFSCVVASDMAFVSILKRRQTVGPDSIPRIVYESFTPWTHNLDNSRTNSSLGQDPNAFTRFPDDRVFGADSSADESPLEPVNSQPRTIEKSGFRVINLGEIDLTNFLGESSSLIPERDFFAHPEDDFNQSSLEHYGDDWNPRFEPAAQSTPNPSRFEDLTLRNSPDAVRQLNPFADATAIPYPIEEPPTKVQPADNSNDRAIANLVAELLDTGDRRVRQTMKEPLKKMLEQRFDAEQTAREQLLEELRKRFDTATQQVKDRATKREQIINDQLQRMLSLPEDEFEILPEPKQPNAPFRGSSA